MAVPTQLGGQVRNLKSPGQTGMLVHALCMTICYVSSKKAAAVCSFSAFFSLYQWSAVPMSAYLFSRHFTSGKLEHHSEELFLKFFMHVLH